MEAIVFYLLIVQKIYQFKAKDSEKKNYPFCLGNIAGGFSAKNMKKNTGLNGCVYNFSADHTAFGTSNIIDIHKYLIIFGFIKKMFFVFLTNLVNASNHTKSLSLSNQNVKFSQLLIMYILMNTVKN